MPAWSLPMKGGGSIGSLGVRLRVDGKHLCYWLLPGQELPDSVPADAVPPDLEPWLGPLKAALGPVLETWDTGDAATTRSD